MDEKVLSKWERWRSIINNMSHCLGRRRKFLGPLLLVGMAIWKLPWPIVSPGAGLDPSWAIGLQVCFKSGLHWGKDVVFTYGPLNFLAASWTLYRDLWIISLGFALLIHILFFSLVFFLFYDRQDKGWPIYLITILVLFFATPGWPMPMYKISFILSLSLFLVFSHEDFRKREKPILIFLGILMAVGGLIKFTLFVHSLSFLVVFSLIQIFKEKRFFPSLFLALSFLISLLLIWFSLGYSLGELRAYLTTSFSIANGYSEAASIRGPKSHLVLAIFSFLTLFFLLGWTCFYKNTKAVLFILLHLPLLFFAYKHGLVRHDPHHVRFFLKTHSLFYLFLFLVLFPSWPFEFFRKEDQFHIQGKWKEAPPFLGIIFLFIFFLFFFLTLQGIWRENILKKLPSYKLAFAYLRSASYFEKEKEQAKRNIRKVYQLDKKIRSQIGKEGVDIFPWDIALLWAEDMHWKPRPVMQSQTNYMPSLDKLTASFLESSKSPPYILYQLSSIDGRYPPFDEPATFRSLIQRYGVSLLGNRFLCLKKREKPLLGESWVEVKRYEIKARLNQEIKIPHTQRDLVFAFFKIPYSLWGKIRKFLYTPSFLYFQFRLKDGKLSQKYRFIPSNAQNGLLVSHYLDNLIALSIFLQREKRSNVESIIISTKGKRQYIPQFTIEFIQVKRKIPRISRNETKIDLLEMFDHGDSYTAIRRVKFKERFYWILFAHPKPEGKNLVSFQKIQIPKGGKLKFGIALDPYTWQPREVKANEVVFEIWITDKKEGRKKIFSYDLYPQMRKKDQQILFYHIDLSQFAGEKVSFDFVTHGKNNLNYDWAWWVNPRIERE